MSSNDSKMYKLEDLYGQYTSAYEKIDDALSHIYMNFTCKGLMTHSGMARGNVKVTIESTAREALTELNRECSECILDHLANTYKDAYINLQRSIIKEVGYENLNMKNHVNHRFDRANESYTSDFVENVTNRLFSDICFLMDRIVLDEIAYGKMSRTVSGEFGKAYERIMQMVKCEEHRVTEMARYECAHEFASNGLSMFKTWNCVIGETRCEQHAHLDRTTVPMNDQFLSEDGQPCKMPWEIHTYGMSRPCTCFLMYGLAGK